MTDITVPEELDTLSDEALSELSEDIKAAAEALAADAATDDEALASMEALVADYNRVREEIGTRESVKEDRASRAAAALKLFQGEGEADEDDAADDDEDDAEAEPVAAEPVAASVTEAEEASTSEAPAEEAPAAEAPAETTVVEASTTTPAVEATIPAPEDAVSDTPVQTTATASLDAGRPDALAPREESVATAATFAATNAVPGAHEGQKLSLKEVASAITRKRHGFGSVSAGTYEPIVLGTAQTEYEYAVGGSEEANFEVLENVRKAHYGTRKEEVALVAAGGVCAPLAPSYDFFRLAEEQDPVERSLPVAEAPRGGIRFITPPDFRDASGGVRVTTEAEDAAGYPPTEPKPCVRVECPPVEECRVDAVSQCVTFGNLNYRVFPEQVEAFLADLAVIFTETKEIFYLDAIDAASTNVDIDPAYSAVRGLTHALLAAAANYRRRHHMSPDAVLDAYLPSWVVEFVKVDLINDHSMGLGFLGAGQAEVDQVFATMNIDITWYYDSATGAGQAFNEAQAAGDANAFPSTVVAYLFAPGTFVRLNAGTLDLGIVRDSVLNGTNDLQIFAEEWIQVCQVGIESLRLEITLCPDGTAPEPVAPLDCTAVSA